MKEELLEHFRKASFASIQPRFLEEQDLFPLLYTRAKSLDEFKKLDNGQWDELLAAFLNASVENNKRNDLFRQYRSALLDFTSDNETHWRAFLRALGLPLDKKTLDGSIALFHKYAKSVDELKKLNDDERFELKTELLKDPPNTNKLSYGLQLLSLWKLYLVVR